MKFLAFLGHFFLMAINILTGSEVGANGTIAIQVLEIVKQVIKSDVADDIVKLIPGTWDDNLLEKIRKALFNTLTKLDYKDVTGALSLHDLLLHIVDDIKNIHPRYQSTYIHNIGSQLLRELADSGMAKHEADTIIQLLYAKFKDENSDSISTPITATTNITEQNEGSNNGSADGTSPNTTAQ